MNHPKLHNFLKFIHSIKKSNQYLLIGFFFFHGLASYAQESSSDSVDITESVLYNESPRLNKQYWKGYLQSTKNLVTAPFHWQTKDWAKFGGWLGVSFATYQKDEQLQSWVQNQRTTSRDRFTDFLEPLGNKLTPIITMSSLYLYGSFTHKHHPRSIALKLLESYFFTGGLTQTIKLTSGRQRPDESNSSKNWNLFQFKRGNSSFYSGHSTVAWMLATVFAHEFKSKKAVPIISYSLSTLASLSRIYVNKHWTSDVVIGSSLTFFVTKTILKRHSKNTDKDEKLSIIPYYQNNQSGIVLNWSF